MVVYEEPEVYQADIDEISRLRSLTERETVIRLLNEQITKLNAIVPKAIQQREERLKREEEERRLEEERKQRAENLKAMGVRMPKPIETTQATVQTIYITTNYGWRESEASVFIYLNIPGAEDIEKDQYEFTVQPKSVNIDIKNHKGVNYNFKLSSFHGEVIPEKSRVKLKKDQVALIFKKKEEGKEWKELRYKTTRDLYNDLLRAEEKGDTDTPSAANVSALASQQDEMREMMRKMYENGDPETKRMMAQTFAQTQDAKNGMGGMPGLPGMGGLGGMMDPFGFMSGHGGHDHDHGSGGHGHSH